MKDYAVAGVTKPYNDGDNNSSSFNLKFYTLEELKNFLYDLEEFDEELSADKLFTDIKKKNSYRFSAADNDFIVKKIK